MENDNGMGEKKPGLSWSQPPVQQPGSTKIAAAPQMHNAAPPAKKGTTGKVAGAFIAGIIVYALVAWIWTANQVAAPTVGSIATTTSSVASTANSGGTSVTPVLQGNASLNIPSPQNAGLEVAVTSAVVSEPTWVVIYENHNGTPGNALGAALFTKDRQSGVVELLRGTLPGQTYFAGEARDDGDHMFSMRNDPAVRDQNGSPLWLEFRTN